MYMYFNQIWRERVLILFGRFPKWNANRLMTLSIEQDCFSASYFSFILHILPWASFIIILYVYIFKCLFLEAVLFSARIYLYFICTQNAFEERKMNSQNTCSFHHCFPSPLLWRMVFLFVSKQSCKTNQTKTLTWDLFCVLKLKVHG